MKARTDWPWWKVKAELARRSLSLSAIALANGWNRSAVSQLPRKPIPNIQEAIARALGLRASFIWPTRYERDGTPIRAASWSRKYRPIPANRNDKNRRAA